MNNYIKNICYVAASALLAINISSCNDLDEDLKSVYGRDNAYITYENAVQGVNGIYASLQMATARAIFYLNDMSTDACYKAGMDNELLNDNNMNGNMDVSRSWLAYNQITGRANDAIDNIPNIPDNRFIGKEVTREELMAQAYFMRAFGYYQLTDLFYRVPLVTNSWIEATTKVPLASVEELDAQIEKDLLIAMNNLPDSYASLADAGRPTKGAVYGYLMRLYMRAAGRTRLSGGDATAKWNQALMYADKVIEQANKGYYSLQPTVWDVFDPSTDKTLYNNEIIFAVRSSKKFPSGASDIGMNFTPWSYNYGWDLFSVPLELVWMFDKTDQRYTNLLAHDYDDVYKATNKRTYVLPQDITQVGTLYKETPSLITIEMEQSYTEKYHYQAAGTYNYNTNNNMILLRYADVLLCKAEILNELKGPNQESVDLINMIRERAFQDVTHNLVLTDYPSADDLRSAICDERLLELNNEGVRRPDLIRMGLWKDRMDKYMDAIKAKVEMKEVNNTVNGIRPDFSSDWRVYPKFSGMPLKKFDKRRYYPIPKRETDSNSDLLNNRNFSEE
ncbi:MAG: RagB/SusD family nutrient uptake outer membrane protein [Dysgonomonas sp.]